MGPCLIFDRARAVWILWKVRPGVPGGIGTPTAFAPLNILLRLPGQSSR